MEFDTTALTPLAVTYGLQLLSAIATLVVGLYIVKTSIRIIGKVFDKSAVDPSLKSFLTSMFSILLRFMVYVSALGMLGIEMTSFIAILGAAGLAVGMALSGTLQNFAGGVMILLFKPYKVGNFIEAQGYTGAVKEIQIFTTVLTTSDNKTVLIPNGPLANGAMINYSTQPTRRVDWTFGIRYGDDLDKAFTVLNGLIAADERILQDPEPFMALAELADSSVNIVVRVWVAAADYSGVYFKMNEEVYRSFENQGLSIPYPQMDVHVQQS
jgi:small conductance mechanosensitive channel